MNLKNLLGAAAVAVALPMSAGAVIIENGIDPQDGPFALPGTFFSNVEFTPGESGTLSWDFINSGSGAEVVTLAVANITQFMANAFFTGGATTSLGEDSHFSPQGGFEAFMLSTVIAPGETKSLVFDFGTVVEKGNNNVAFDFNVAAAAIPLPASVLMLLAGLGGLGIVCRRRSATA